MVFAPSHLSPSISAKILIVDDKIDNLNLLTTMLSEEQYEVRRAVSGKIALQAVQGFQPDLILLDITMPDMNGYEVCKQLKADPSTKHIAVIFISALNDVFDKVTAFSSGGVDYITKPFEISEVLARVANQLNLTSARAEVIQLNQELEQRVEKRTRQLKSVNASLEEEVRQRQSAQEELRHKAFHDDLTDLPNRAYLLTEIEAALELSKTQPDYQFAVLFLDCDRFKLVNDSLGHAMGDQLLIAIAQRLEKILPPDGQLFRPGGDEFMVLLRQIAKPQQVEALAEQLLEQLSQPFYLSGHELYLTVSIGIALGHQRYDKPEDILRDVDTALYQAKAQGKAHSQTFHPKMHQRALRRLQLEHQMRRAIREQEFALVYQPIMDIQGDNESVAGFEALIRWHHPKHGWVSPDDFIPIAEETGLIIPIGQWVLEEACRQAREWEIRSQDPAFPLHQIPWKMSINLSVKQFSSNQLIPALDEILASTGLQGDRLKLEITETALMENADSARTVLAELKQRHIELAIDDFGTGYSSLSYLHRFPVDTLKIDRCFMTPPVKTAAEQLTSPTEGFTPNDHDLRIIKAAVNLARDFEMDTVAEGVETKEVLAQLKQMGCTYGQGYYFSKPLSSTEMDQWLGKVEQQAIA